MDQFLHQRIEKSIRDNGAIPTGIKQNRVTFRYRGIGMAMYTDEVTYSKVKQHIKEKIKDHYFPKCASGCGQELRNGLEGLSCIMCSFKWGDR